MTSRQPAGDQGTANRVEADLGYYWVRLMSPSAIRREGDCMLNCLRHCHVDGWVGDEDPLATSVWSLRDSADGVSIADVETYFREVLQIQGPKCSQASAFAYRQLRHLVARFGHAGETLDLAPIQVLTGPDGMTHREDRAPLYLREAREAEELAERQAGEDRARQLEELLAEFESRGGA